MKINGEGRRALLNMKRAIDELLTCAGENSATDSLKLYKVILRDIQSVCEEFYVVASKPTMAYEIVIVKSFHGKNPALQKDRSLSSIQLIADGNLFVEKQRK